MSSLAAGPTPHAGLPTAHGRFQERMIPLLLAVALPVVYLGIPAVRGAIGIPHNDDWTYYRSLFEFVETGQFQADPFTRASLIGQIVAAAPLVLLFGENIAAVQIAAALAAVGAVIVLYRSVLPLLGLGPALLVSVTFALNPVHASLSASYMTDLLSVVVQVLALAAAAVAVRGQQFRWSWWIAAAALSFWGFTIREYAVAAVVTLGVVVICTRWRFDRTRTVFSALGVVAGVLALCVAFFLWRTNLPGAGVPGRVAEGDPMWVVIQVIRVVFTLSLFVAPAAMLALGRAGAFARGRPVSSLLLAAALAAVWCWAKWWFWGGLLLPNYVSVNGPYAETLFGAQPLVFTLEGWLAVEVVAGLSAIVIGLAACSTASVAWTRLVALVRNQGKDPGTTTPTHLTAVVWGLHGAISVLVTVGVSVVTDAPIFERYLLAAVPGIAAALAYSGRAAWSARGLAGRAIGVLATAAVLAHGALGLLIADTSATRDGAVWRLNRSVEASGYPAHEIDGGYAWWGLHQPGAITSGQFGGDHGESLWILLFDDPRVCVRTEYWTPEVRPDDVVAETTATTLHGFTFRLIAVDQRGTAFCP